MPNLYLVSFNKYEEDENLRICVSDHLGNKKYPNPKGELPVDEGNLESLSKFGGGFRTKVLLGFVDYSEFKNDDIAILQEVNITSTSRFFR